MRVGHAFEEMTADVDVCAVCTLPSDRHGLVGEGAVTVDRSWMADASCRGKTDLFYGVAGERYDAAVAREQRCARMCAACPVLMPCAEYAQEQLGRRTYRDRSHGVWAGVSHDAPERERVRHVQRGYDDRRRQERVLELVGRTS